VPDPRVLRALAIGRVGIGIAALAAPSLAPRPLVGRAAADQPWARLLARMTGAREIALGMIVLRAPQDRVLLGWAGACDAADGWAALADRDLPLPVRALWGATALPLAAYEVAAALRG
jgi:hypothetical protein